jgi:FtsH-binding integral membrane protein
VLVIAVVGLAASRVLLAVPKLGAVFVIIGLAALVFGLANLLSRRPESLRSVLLGVLIVGGLVLIVAGIVAEVVGPRDEEGLAADVPAVVAEQS